jgi:hypothetical protein
MLLPIIDQFSSGTEKMEHRDIFMLGYLYTIMVGGRLSAKFPFHLTKNLTESIRVDPSPLCLRAPHELGWIDPSELSALDVVFGG